MDSVKTIPIEYIGRKPVKYDTTAHSGAVWRGKGDVQQVEEPYVARLLDHPTIWRVAGKTGGQPAKAPAPVIEPKPATVPHSPLAEAMEIINGFQSDRDKADLEAYIKDLCGMDLDRRFGIEKLRARAIELAEAYFAPRAGAPVQKDAQKDEAPDDSEDEEDGLDDDDELLG